MAIHLVEHDRAWAEDFSDIVRALHARLGTLVSQYEHVGSTSVAGLATKPKIHVDATLRSAADLAAAVRVIAREGYDDLGFLHSAEDYQLTFAANKTGAYTKSFGPFRVAHRLCLCMPGSSSARDRLRFRDRLKGDTALRVKYQRLKADLAQRFGPIGDWDGYNYGKSAFIQAALCCGGSSTANMPHKEQADNPD